MNQEITFSVNNSREYRLTPAQFNKLELEVDYLKVAQNEHILGGQVAGYIHIPENPEDTRGLCEIVNTAGKRLALITMKQAFNF